MKLYRAGEVRTHKSTYPLQASNILKRGYYFTAGDINSDTISLKIDSAISSTIPYAWNTLAYSDGAHIIELSALDKAGNSALASITVILDNTPPAVSLPSPVNNSYVSRIVIIEGIAADSNLSGMNLSIDDTEVSSSLPYSWDTSSYSDGIHTLRLSAWDKAGNAAIIEAAVTVDNTVPIVSITSPKDGALLRQAVEINGAITEINIRSINLTIDDTEVSNSLPYLWDSTKITDGAHEIRLSAEDKAGNTASTSIEVKVDNTPPDIFNVIPKDKLVVNNTYSISADYDDAGSGIDINSFSLLIDGIDETKDASITNTSMQYKPSLQDGKHILKLSINDTVGNSRTVTTSFELDTTPPEVKINFPSNNSFVRKTITVSGAANDLHLDTVFLEIDGIKVSNTPTYLWDTATVKDGTHEVGLSAVDTVQNSAYMSINVIVDNTPPIIQVYPANGTEFYSDQNLRIDYNMTDAMSGVVSSSATLDGIGVTKGDLIDLRTLSIGSHTIRAIAIDNAGNNAESSTIFIVKPLQAVVEIEPNTLNMNSSGRWIQAKIQILGYDASLIDVSSIRLNGIIQVEIKPDETKEDKDSSKLEVKFNRTQVQSIVSLGDVTLHISGKVNGAAFVGNNTIRVIENQKSDLANEDDELGNKLKMAGKTQ